MALVVVLTLLSIMGLLFGVAGNHQGLSIKASGADSEIDSAYFVSHGALQRALTELRNDPDWGGKMNGQFPGRNDARFDIEIFRNTGGTPKPTPAGVEIPPNTTLVLSTGRVGNSSRLMAGILGMSNTGTSGFAALAREQLLVKGGRVSAFTTSGGFSTAEMEPVPLAGQLASIDEAVEMVASDPDEAGVILPAEVDGVVASDRVDGDTSTVEADAYSIDELSSFGGETQLTDPPALEDIAVPNYEGGLAIWAGGGTKTITPGHYDKFNSVADATVIMEAGDYYFSGDFRMKEDSKVLTNGPVRIFAQNQFQVSDKSALNFEGNPKDCEVILTQTKDTGWVGIIGGEGSIWGRVKASRGPFLVSGYLYGDLQAKDISIYGETNGSGTVKFFTDLGEVSSEAVVGNFIYTTTWVVR